MFRTLLSLILIIVVCSKSLGQLQVYFNDQKLNSKHYEISYLIDSTCYFQDDISELLKESKWVNVEDHLNVISYNPNCVYIRISLIGISKIGNIDWIAIENPHINRLKFWLLEENKVIYVSKLTGDGSVFSSRPTPSRQYLLPADNINKNLASIVIAADKRHTKLEIPIRFQDNAYFIDNADADLKGIFFFLGFAFFLFLFNAYLFSTTKEPVFGYYLIYLLIIVLFICIDSGLFFKWLYPDFPLINDIIRPASFALSIVPMILFFNNILPLKEQHPRIAKFNNVLNLLYLILFIVATIQSSITEDLEVHKHWLNANRIITPLMLACLLAETIYFIRKRYTIAYFLLGSYTSLIIFMIVFIGLQLNLLPAGVFTSYALYWGLAADGLFMALSLAWRLHDLRKKSANLQIEKDKIQEMLSMEIASWKEQQMSQFSSLLHDRIGGLIGVLRLTVDNMELSKDGKEQVSSKISLIAEEIRQYSHSFSPAVLGRKGLKLLTTEFVNNIRDDSKIDIQFEWIGNEKIESARIEMIIYFFIQEILHNMIKHSSCDHAILQVFNEDHMINVYLEDDGVGCETVNYAKGIGLQSMQRIIGLLDGKFLINTLPGQGFAISIELYK